VEWVWKELQVLVRRGRGLAPDLVSVPDPDLVLGFAGPVELGPEKLEEPVP